MNILFLVPYPLAKAPSQRFRFEQYLAILKERGHNYTLQPFLDERAWSRIYSPGNFFLKALDILKGFVRRFFVLFKAADYDFIFIHREAAPLGPPIFEWMIAKILKKKIIYDFDDAIWISNTSEENKIAADLKWHQKVKLICKWSYKVSCGNEYLCIYAAKFNGKVVYNPTTIDTEYLHNPKLRPDLKKTESIVIGWTGSHSTLHYLDALIPVFSKLEKTYNFKFLVIANKNPECPLKSFEFKQWDVNSEIYDLSLFDIGIMPLTADQWSEGKCGFKALQYMALEIPAVVSPVGVNKTIVDHGINGFHCATEDDWERFLIELMDSYSLRKEMGKKGREKVESYFSIASNEATFLGLFE